MSNAYQDDGDRYIVVEVPGEATAEQFEEIASQVMTDVGYISERGSLDLFTFVPHSHQEDVLRELFGDREGTDGRQPGTD